MHNLCTCNIHARKKIGGETKGSEGLPPTGCIAKQILQRTAVSASAWTVTTERSVVSKLSVDANIETYKQKHLSGSER